MAVPRVSIRDTAAQPVTPELINKIKIKNRLRKQHQRNRDPVIKRQINSLTKEIRSEMLDLRIKRWNNTVQKECGGGGNPFKLCRRLIKTRVLANAFERYHGLPPRNPKMQTK